MTCAALPAELAAALTRKSHGLSLSDAASRAGAMSQTYRSGGGSTAIRSEADALAYALARMPATYAAVAACLDALAAQRPGFAPQTLLDCGAGPGTASWAAAERFDTLLSFALLDANAALRALALDLMQGSARLAAPAYGHGDALALLAKADPAELVIASYMINELSETQRNVFADLAWAKTTDTLLIVEPGTPAGYARILALRARLITQGAQVAAPCPHDNGCPLSAPDWCHFTQRLPRSRAHQHLKGAELAYEDEKFSYVALTRAAVAPRPARVLAQPVTTKIAVTAKLCTAAGLDIAVAPRRNKPDYARFRKLDWGDTV
ncbi:ribosomal protein RSM22 (predicted rRNA methylase) [Rhodopseudomonas rhenobacensis]|uniref:Ribosomal protein RSM22 (Predicted rRNA methylase) n=1 Tax=Rhodopseudomonas rhenobacensis TaxID=87461 RepID=A0A7W8DXX0_9BRAD|nr:small ribosomal subunit Rsm22 family protein [Rhodopseudomonas rhenobacensis]MBB5046684.1 ribosomal protein RSM22 (predicted rRNA methylase) [Rhodopseudomonas rhenobacensis]